MFWHTRSASEMEEELLDLEEQSSHIRNRQAVLVNELDKISIAGSTGCRSTAEWVSSRLDVSPTAASDLVFAARQLKKHRQIEYRLVNRDLTFDRTVAMLRLATAGADAATLEHSETMDLAGVAGLTARQRRVTRLDEYEVFTERYVAIQPTLDESSWRLSGRLPSVEGRIVEEALHRRGDEMRLLPGGDTCSRGQRQADSLVAMARDSLDRTGDTEASSGSSVTVFVDLDEASGTGGEKGCEIEYGPRVGPNTLEELLCTGTVQIMSPMEYSVLSTEYRVPSTPPAGGRFHHHIAIHQQGLRIDPDSPPLKRRLIQPRPGHDPP